MSDDIIHSGFVSSVSPTSTRIQYSSTILEFYHDYRHAHNCRLQICQLTHTMQDFVDFFFWYPSHSRSQNLKYTSKTWQPQYHTSIELITSSKQQIITHILFAKHFTFSIYSLSVSTLNLISW